MPKVGDKEFPYDEEGIAAAEAEAARTGLPVDNTGEGDQATMIDEIMAQLPEEGEEPPAEPAGAEVPAEAMEEVLDAEEPAPLPDEGLMMQLFQVVYGADYDPASPEDQQRMSEIQSVLEGDPAMAEGLMSGDVSMTEFALRLYRNEPEAPAPAPAPAAPPEPAPY